MSRVGDVLRVKGTHVLTAAPDTSVMRVAQRMRQEHVGALVVSSVGRRFEGVITERDVVFGLARHGPALLDMPASAVMSPGTATCGPDDSVRSAMTKMTHARVRHLPVFDQGVLCGVISIGDVVKACIDDAELETNVLRDAYVGHHSR